MTASKHNTLLAVLFAALLLQGCIDDPAPLVRDLGHELSFSAFSPRTKGLVTGTALEDDATGEARTLTISSYLHPQSGREGNYFKNETFSLSDGRWRHDPAIYWPMGGELDFLAYSSTAPFSQADADWGTVRWGEPNAAERVRLGVGPDRTQDDILYGALYHSATSQSDALSLEMNHAQAWIDVRLGKTENVSGDVIVTRVALSNVYLAGDLTIENNFGDPVATWNTRRYYRQDIQVDDLNSVMGQPLPTGEVSLSMLLPEQEMTTLTIDYIIRGEEKTWSKELDHATWLMGKHYIYTVSFDEPPVGDLTFTVTEEPWNAGTEYSSYEELLLGNVFYATASRVDAIGDGFDFSSESEIYWRSKSTKNYIPLVYHDGTWGVSVDYQEEEWDINISALSFGEKNFNCTATKNVKRTPLTFTAKEGGVLYFNKSNSGSPLTIEYSLNEGPWTPWTAVAGGAPIALVPGDELRVRGDNPSYYYSTANYHRFRSDATLRFDLSGNLTSIINSDSFQDVESITSNNAFQSLFQGTNVVSARNLLLTATTVSQGCYLAMFADCVNMTEAPKEIAADSSPANVFQYMFSNCPSLTSPPERLNGTTMGDHAAYRMFYNCKALTRCPDGLDDKTTLRDYAFSEMFYGCSNLSENVPDELVATSLPRNAYHSMFNGTAITRAPEILAETLTGGDAFNGMFYNCKSLVTPPSEIKITVFNQNACLAMFGNCTSLTYTPEITVNTVSGSDSFKDTFSGCTSLSTINIEWNETALKSGTCRNMFYNCDALTTAMPMEIVSIAGASCLSMYSDCDNLVSAPITFTVTDFSAGGDCCSQMFRKTKLPAALPMTVTKTGKACFNEMYYLCKSLTACDAVTITASTLEERCCMNMFRECSSLATPMDAIGSGPTTFGSRSCECMFYSDANMESMPAMDIASTAYNCCCNMFAGNRKIVQNRATFSAPSIGEQSFDKMFVDCVSLVNAPDFVATSVARRGCAEMYCRCSALANAPAMPMMTLGASCYTNMFSTCNSLTTAPALPATAAAWGCYESMFSNCANLVTGPSIMPMQTTEVRCCRGMFLNCKKMTSCFTDIPATEAAAACFSSMFQGCSALLAGPQLHLTKCADLLNITGGLVGCCHDMFSNCNAMVTGPTDFGEATPGTRCFYRMFYNCWALTTAPAKMSAESMKELCYYGMFLRCYALQTPPQLPSMLMANACYHEMFYDCYGLTSFPDLPATILAPNCYYSMFKFSDGNQARLTTAPDLPAATLEEGCYREMFRNQRTLNSARMSATNTTAANALNAWMDGVSASGTLTLSTGVTLPAGTSGVPNGWTVVYE